jgi:hypothetical protein
MPPLPLEFGESISRRRDGGLEPKKGRRDDLGSLWPEVEAGEAVTVLPTVRYQFSAAKETVNSVIRAMTAARTEEVAEIQSVVDAASAGGLPSSTILLRLAIQGTCCAYPFASQIFKRWPGEFSRLKPSPRARRSVSMV